MKKIFFAAAVAMTALFTSCNNGSPRANLKTDIDTLSYEMGMAMSQSKTDFENYLAQSGSDSAYVDELLKGYLEGMNAADDKKKMAYYMGVMQGLQTKMQMPMIEQQVFQGDSTKKVSVKNFIAGFMASAKGKSALKIDGKVIDKEGAQKAIMDYMFGSKKQESEAYMQKMAKQPGVVALGSGIYGKQLAAGTDEHCTATDSVTVKYEGKLTNGTVFDTSDKQPGGVATFSLRNVIKGWSIAIPKMGVGSTWEVYIPYNLAYGEQGTGPIPPFAALTFKVTLVKVNK